MTEPLHIPAGLNGLPVADTTLGDVDGDRGFFHYRQHDATDLARTATFEEVWHLFAQGHLPTAAELADFHTRVAERRRVPEELQPLIAAAATASASPLARLRTILSAGSGALGLRPLLDLDEPTRRDQAMTVAAVVPSLLAGLYRAAHSLPLVDPDPSLGHASAYLYELTGEVPSIEAARALEQYLVLTVDHGFNASTFTSRVVASTGADLADVVCAGIGALAGPLHGGAPGRALDALDAIGDASRAPAYVRAEVAAGRRIMGFGHPVYRAPDPRSTLLREIAGRLGGDLVERATEVEAAILTTLVELKPDRPLPSNVEYYAGIVMASVGLPREMFTPTFAMSRTVGWCAHAVEQAAAGKLIRPAARYVGPPVERPDVIERDGDARSAVTK